MKSRALLFGVPLLLGSGAALAQGPHGHGPGSGPMRRCAKLLMHAHADTLKGRLGLNDAQVQRIRKIRTNALNKKADLQAALFKGRVQCQDLWQADLPEQGKILAHMRKMRGVRAKLMEEQVKALLKMMKVMNKEQRSRLRSRCLAFDGPARRGGPGDGFGRGRRRQGCPHCEAGDFSR